MSVLMGKESVDSAVSLATKVSVAKFDVHFPAPSDHRMSARRIVRGFFGAVASLLGFGQSVVIVDASDATTGPGWTAGLALNAAAALLLAAIAANGSRVGAGWAVELFYFAIAMIFTPIAARIIYPNVSRGERIALVLTAAAALFAIRMIRSPTAFIDHDEFLHWLTVKDIIEQGRLFTPNALLPVSPKFPGLEVLTAAIVELSGASVFVGAMIVLAVCRMVFMATLYLVFQKMTESPRVASIACLFYMGSSTFLIFDSHFAYESLAVVFLILAVYSSLISQSSQSPWIASAVLTVPFLAALAVTHHMTAFFASGLFVGIAVLNLLGSRDYSFRGMAIAIAAIAVAIPMVWSHMMGNPTGGYLGPVIKDGLSEVSRLLSSSQGRELFVSEDGSVAPAWQRAIAISSVALICVGLATGFIRSLRFAGVKTSARHLLSFRSLRHWRNGRLVLLIMLTLAYPLSILFRLTRAGWEIGNRIGPFSFLGVSIVMAIGVASFWQSASKYVVRAMALAAAATVVVIGGIISSEGPRILVPAQFRVSADSASVEPMGISAAEWTRTWLGAENLFASDRINRLLLATYGGQQVATTLRDPRDSSIAIQSTKLRSSDVLLLRQIGVDYVLADLRLTTALPVVGVYFDGGATDRVHSAPLSAKSLLKFNAEPNVSRTFDNGYQIIFDVRKLDVAR
jgi:hypothetical protein